MKRLGMATINSFFGIKILIYPKETYDEGPHHIPHIHAEYGGKDAFFNIETCEIIEGDLGKNQNKMVETWIFIHQNELMEIWNTHQLKKIQPLS